MHFTDLFINEVISFKYVNKYSNYYTINLIIQIACLTVITFITFHMMKVLLFAYNTKLNIISSSSLLMQS